MSCQVGTQRVVKMGFDYGTVQLLSTATIEEHYKEELKSKDIVLTSKEFVAHTPLANNYVVQSIHELSQKVVIALFNHAIAVNVVHRILSNTITNWLLICTSRDAYTEAMNKFPNNQLMFLEDDASLATNIRIACKDVSTIVHFGNNKIPAYYPMLLRGAGFEYNDLMVYQSSIKSTTVEEHYNGILFFDEQSVDSYFTFNDLSQNVVAFCINEAVGNHLTKKLNQPTIVVQAAAPTVLSMIESILVYYNR